MRERILLHRIKEYAAVQLQMQILNKKVSETEKTRLRKKT